MRSGFVMAVGVVVAGLLLAPFAVAQDGEHHPGMKMGGDEGMSCSVCEMRMKEAANLAEIRGLLEEAKGAAEEAGADTAVKKIDAALAKIEARHQAMHAAMKKHMAEAHEGKMPAGMKCPLCMKSKDSDTAKVVNESCPMTGEKIDPANVPDNLIREFHGKKVGFCCGGCPGKWDKLSDEEKEAKLKKAMHHDGGDSGDEGGMHHGGGMRPGGAR